jgi:hypothetical protein
LGVLVLYCRTVFNFFISCTIPTGDIGASVVDQDSTARRNGHTLKKLFRHWVMRVMQTIQIFSMTIQIFRLLLSVSRGPRASAYSKDLVLIGGCISSKRKL